MSNDLALKIPQITDRVLISKYSELYSKFNVETFQASAATQLEINWQPIKGENGKLPAPWDTIHELNSSLIYSYQARIKALTIAYYRRGRDKSSPIYDEIVVYFNSSLPMPASERLEVIAWAEKAFKAFDPKRHITLEPEAAELTALHESTLIRLEGVAERVIEETAAAYAQLEQQYLSKRERLEEQFLLDKAKLDTEHAARTAAFEAKEAALSARQASIDDRDNTHARRATRNAMLEDVKERILNFGLSPNTTAKRWNVVRGFLALFAVLFIMLVWSLFEAGQLHQLRIETLAAKANTTTIAAAAAWDKTDLYVVWARISILTLGLLFSILYYIKWQNRWSEQHTTAEFQLQQFYVDVNRANWVVESGLEWHKETGSTIPDTIMQSLTNNLFRYSDEAPPALHPADELASALLGSASKLKLKAGDSELEFDKPSRIKGKETS
jgi:hypothetical protein